MAETTTPVTPPAARRGLRWGLGLMLALLALVLVAVAAATALLRSEAGTAWLLARVPGVEVQGLHGALLGDTLGADRISWYNTVSSSANELNQCMFQPEQRSKLLDVLR